MNLESYKKKVEECLLKIQKVSTQVKDKLMKEYETDFQEFLEEDYKPEMVAYGMVTHLL